MSVLSADFHKRFPGAPGIHVAFERPTGQFSVTILFGHSGCGKTTVLRCLAGLERPEQGWIRWGDESWFEASSGTFVSPQDRGIGLLFQDYALFPHMTVAANISYGLRELSRDARRRRVHEMLELLGISGIDDRYPSELSGGEQQRVALARVVARKPRLLLLDEPLSALDAPTREALRRELRHLLSTFAIPCFIVTHDRLEALALGDHVMVMHRGRVRQHGLVSAVFSQPADSEVARLVGVDTIVRARIEHVEDGLATLSLGDGRARLVAVAPPAPNREALACIRGEDVVLRLVADAGGSARNHLPGRVTAIEDEGPLVRVTLDCGFRLVSLVTRQSRDELRLRPGADVIAQIKTPAVHLITR